MNPTELAKELNRLAKSLGLAQDAVRITAEPLGHTLWLHVQVVMGPSDTEKSVRERILDELADAVTWYSPGESTVITTFSKGRGRRRKDGAATRRTAEVSVSLREPAAIARGCDWCDEPGGH